MPRVSALMGNFRAEPPTPLAAARQVGVLRLSSPIAKRHRRFAVGESFVSALPLLPFE